jgi:hypothetical protein
VGSFTEEAYLREKVHSLHAGLLCRLDEYVEAFPRGQSRDLIGTIRLFLSEIDDEVSTCHDLEVIRWFCRLIDELAEVLEWLDHAHTAQTPRAYVDVLCELSRLLHGGAEILVTPTVETNYRIADEIPRLSKLTNALSPSRQERVLKALPNALYRVRFPRVERDNILNHALFGHEFGHPIADEFYDDYEAEVRYQEDLNKAQSQVEQDDDIAADLAEIEDDTDRTAFINEVQTKLSDIHRRAVIELVSDAIAVHVFGPSALFASMDLLIREGLDEVPEFDEYYPPTRYRWRLMLQLLERSGYVSALRALQFDAANGHVKDALDSTLDYLESVVAETTDQQMLKRDAYIRAAYDWLADILPDALRDAEDRAAPAKYNAELLSMEVPALVERLRAGVPPSQVGTWPKVSGVDWRSTFTAGWLFALSQVLDKPTGEIEDSSTKLLVTTNRLAVKGIECIFLQREFGQYMRKQRRSRAKSR